MYNPYTPYNPYADISALQAQVQAMQQHAQPQQAQPVAQDPTRQALENEYLKTEEGAKLHAALHEGFSAWRAKREGLNAPLDYGKQIEDQRTHIQRLEAKVKELEELVLK